MAGTRGRRGNVTHEEAERADQSGPLPFKDLSIFLKRNEKALRDFKQFRHGRKG